MESCLLNINGLLTEGITRMLEEGIFDIHCHIVPGVDDGAADIEETRKLLEMEYKQE